MEKKYSLPHQQYPLYHLLLLLLIFFIQPSSSQNLSPSQIKTLIRIQRILHYPPALSPLNASSSSSTNLCYLPSSSSLSISCVGTRVTQLTVHGDRNHPPLPPSFSLDSLFTTLSRLPSLTSLSLVSLGLWGPLPAAKIRRLPALRTLNLSSNYLSGPLPLASIYVDPGEPPPGRELAQRDARRPRKLDLPHPAGFGGEPLDGNPPTLALLSPLASLLGPLRKPVHGVSPRKDDLRRRSRIRRHFRQSLGWRLAFLHRLQLLHPCRPHLGELYLSFFLLLQRSAPGFSLYQESARSCSPS